MGLRGPAPKPTAVEIFEGRPGRRPINPLEPRPPEFGPDAAKKACPKHLNAEEKKHWRHYAPILARMRVLTEADLMALEQLCVLSAQWVELMEMRRKSGLRAHFAKTPNGFTIVSPLMTEIRATGDHMFKLLREFGMTPSGRTRINMEAGFSFSPVGNRPGLLSGQWHPNR